MRYVAHRAVTRGIACNDNDLCRPRKRSSRVLSYIAIVIACLLPASAHGVSLSVIAEAANSGERGLRVILDEAKPGYVQDDSPAALKQYRARFYIRVDELVMPDGGVLPVFGGLTSGDVVATSLSLKREGTEIRMGAEARLNIGTDAAVGDGGEVVLGEGWHSIELQWSAAQDLLSANGVLELWVDGVSVTGLSGLANSSLNIEMVRLGAIGDVTDEMSGWFDLDEFVSRTNGYIGATPTTTGVSDVLVDENAEDTVIPLFPVFADAETADNSLVLAIQNNTNEALFAAVSIDAATGALTLDYATGEFGQAELTIRATDGHGLHVDSVFTVTVTEVPCDVNNDTNINAVDVQLVINAALGIPVSGDTDINGDGPTNAIDIQLLINAVLQ